MSSPSINDGGSDDEERFLRQLKEANPMQYYYNWDSFPIKEAMDLRDVKHYSYSELEEITSTSINKYNPGDYIFRTMHGRLFHGRIKMDSSSLEDVIVKTWDLVFPLRDGFECYPARLHDELIFLRDPEIKSHPNVVKLVGYHCEKSLAAIYKCKRPAHILVDILNSDYFEWEDRMKVAIEIGSVLKMFHDKGLLHGGNLAWSTILDEKFSPTIFGFQAYTVNKMLYPDFIREGPQRIAFFSYLVVAVEGSGFSQRNGGKNPPNSIVHEYFSVDQSVASKIIDLALRCLEVSSDEQPSIGAALAALQKFASVPAMKKHKLCETTH
ncbi:hypothetical protein Salat_1311200 [Sesamum alatum]|uniref:Protein kinase domain-containing protein n=1 Tax=Sesamum alatum TaxID=300844 RepID=A0AAE1YGX0_9LAMI|nr:hypothetical protein Salat_1311200 [Sesamum alatum]